MAYTCPICMKPMEVSPDSAGAEVSCPHCGSASVFPAPPSPAPVQPPGVKEALALLGSIDARLAALESEARMRRSNSGNRIVAAGALIAVGFGGLCGGIFGGIAANVPALMGGGVFLLGTLCIAKAIEIMSSD